MFSSKSCIILALIFSSEIHFELIFCMWHEVGVQLLSFVCEYPVVHVLFVENTILSPLNFLCYLVENQLTINAWVHF